MDCIVWAKKKEGQLVAADDDVSGDEDDQENSYIEWTCSDGWAKKLEKISDLQDQQPYNSLRQRQLSLIEVGMKRATKERENYAPQAKERILVGTTLDIIGNDSRGRCSLVGNG